MLDNIEVDLPTVQQLPVVDNVEGMGTIDVLAQRVIPKLINMVKQQEWHIHRLEKACEILLQEAQAQRQAYEYLHDWSLKATAQINALAKPPAPATKTRRKKKEVPMSEIADYDPDKDEWTPKEIDGKAVTAKLIDVVDHMGTSAGTMYGSDLLAFIDKLTDAQREAIKEKFPG